MSLIMTSVDFLRAAGYVVFLNATVDCSFAVDRRYYLHSTLVLSTVVVTSPFALTVTWTV